MGIKIPTTKAIVDQAIGIFEGILGQTIPLAKRAWVRVLSVVFGFIVTGLYKFAAERALQNLALTATGEDLKRIGREYGVILKVAVSAVLNISLPAVNGTEIDQTNAFIGDNNGVRYLLNSNTIAAGGVAVVDVTAETAGVVGNLDDDDPLSIENQVPGADTTATVVSTVVTGAEEESEENYRVRVLAAIRTKGGGGNAVDYRAWGEEVPGVARIYPYGGLDINDPEEDSPPDRVIYVEADSSIDPDGIAPQSLLDQVRDSITTDPITGSARQPLGLTDDTLDILSISRRTFFTTVRGLVVDPVKEAQLKIDIDLAVSVYLTSIEPFVTGIDFVSDRNDSITDLTISTVVQDELIVAGASGQAVAFGFAPFTSLPIYILAQGEKAKSGGVGYE